MEGPPTRRAFYATVLGVVTVVAAIAGVAVFIAAKADRSTSRAGNTAGPFTGSYTAEFGPSDTWGARDEGATPGTGKWNIRSVCHSSGCVATATAQGGPTLQSTFVFDKVGENWVAVSTSSVASAPAGVTGFKGCTFPGEYWTVIAVRQQSDSKFSGDYAAYEGNGCYTHRTVTFTRTGDVEGGANLPDPATQPSRVTSPAGALHGHYHSSETYSISGSTVSTDENDYVVVTNCLRTGERCVSEFNQSKNGRVSIFASGKWTYNVQYDYEPGGSCATGATAHLKKQVEYPLPQPTEDPITRLTGRGHSTVTGAPCAAGDYDVDITYKRTGD